MRSMAIAAATLQHAGAVTASSSLAEASDNEELHQHHYSSHNVQRSISNHLVSMPQGLFGPYQDANKAEPAASRWLGQAQA